MIIEAFSEYLHNQTGDKTTVEYLSLWVYGTLQKEPESNVEQIIHKELSCIEDKNGLFLLYAKSDSGRALMQSLYNFAIYFENHKFSKWVHEVRSEDFNKQP